MAQDQDIQYLIGKIENIDDASSGPDEDFKVNMVYKGNKF